MIFLLIRVPGWSDETRSSYGPIWPVWWDISIVLVSYVISRQVYVIMTFHVWSDFTSEAEVSVWQLVKLCRCLFCVNNAVNNYFARDLPLVNVSLLPSTYFDFKVSYRTVLETAFCTWILDTSSFQVTPDYFAVVTIWTCMWIYKLLMKLPLVIGLCLSPSPSTQFQLCLA